MRIKAYSKSTIMLAALLLALVGIVLPGGNASASAAEALKFEDVWARAASAGHMSAAYMTVANTGEFTVDIVSAHADVADKVELHETTTEITFVDGKISQVMRMEEVDVLTIASGETVQLKPGGLHIMLMGLTRDIEEGDTFTLTLQSSTGERIVIDVPVTVGAGDDHDHHHHDH